MAPRITTRRVRSLALAACLGGLTLLTQPARAGDPAPFTYQGVLLNNGAPVNGTVAMTFRLFTQQAGGDLVGTPINQNVTVANGLFTTNLDFGAAVFTTGANRWLQVSLPSGDLTRQLITAAPSSHRTRGIDVDTGSNLGLFGDVLLNKSNAVIGGRQGIGATGSLTIQAPGASESSFSGSAGGELRLRAGDCNSSASDMPPVGTSFGNDVVVQAGQNQFGGLFGSSFAGNIRFIAGDSSIDIPQPERLRIVGDNGFVGIGTTAPINLLDVAGKISLRTPGNGGMVLINEPTYAHAAGPQTFDNGGSPFIVASRESIFESSGVFGDGDSMTLWSPGDGAPGQPAALCYFLDEDGFSAGGNPYSGNSLRAFLANSGVWTVSDQNAKHKLQPLVAAPGEATTRLMQLSGYTYEYKQAPAEIAKGEIPRRESGLLAQEVRAVLPEAVQVNAAGDHFINMTSVTPLLLEALKEQVRRNRELEARLDRLEKLLNAQP